MASRNILYQCTALFVIRMNELRILRERERERERESKRRKVRRKDKEGCIQTPQVSRVDEARQETFTAITADLTGLL